jgi:hypothetical protein
MIQFKKTGLLIMTTAVLFACKKEDVDPIIIIAPSTGSEVQLSGLVGNEPGSSAGNSVFVDFSTDVQTPVERKSWDLGFYTGADFRVILNNTTSATAKGLSKNDLAAVNIADTTGFNNLALGFEATSMLLVDNVHGDLTKTVIAPVSSIDADNKVYIINRGTGGGTPARDWYKIRILRNTNGGYKLQYAKLAATTFTTIDVVKDADYNFKYVSFDGGIVNGEPVKTKWDIKWSYTMFETALDPNTMIPYASSDFISINTKAGVAAAEVLMSNNISYENFSKADANNITFSTIVDAIGTKWRTASMNPGASKVKADRFYVIKDPLGNIYKLKFLSFHNDEGGTRGKPQLKYKLLQ